MRPFTKQAGGTPALPSKRRWLRWIIAAYLALLLVSHLTRLFRPAEVVTGGENKIEVQAVKDERLLNQPVSIAYPTFNSESNDSRPVIVLLHGSPGEADDFRSLAPYLAANYRLIVPDLPGFGYSTSHIPDYSFRAHARYLIEMLDKLKVQRAHLVGFSMGGGVVLSLADIAPERV